MLLRTDSVSIGQLHQSETPSAKPAVATQVRLLPRQAWPAGVTSLGPALLLPPTQSSIFEGAAGASRPSSTLAELARPRSAQGKIAFDRSNPPGKSFTLTASIPRWKSPFQRLPSLPAIPQLRLLGRSETSTISWAYHQTLHLFPLR
jgi:hypothetical protein